MNQCTLQGICSYQCIYFFFHGTNNAYNLCVLGHVVPECTFCSVTVCFRTTLYMHVPVGIHVHATITE